MAAKMSSHDELSSQHLLAEHNSRHYPYGNYDTSSSEIDDNSTTTSSSSTTNIPSTANAGGVVLNMATDGEVTSASSALIPSLHLSLQPPAARLSMQGRSRSRGQGDCGVRRHRYTDNEEGLSSSSDDDDDDDDGGERGSSVRHDRRRARGRRSINSRNWSICEASKEVRNMMGNMCEGCIGRGKRAGDLDVYNGRWKVFGFKGKGGPFYSGASKARGGCWGGRIGRTVRVVLVLLCTGAILVSLGHSMFTLFSLLPDWVDGRDDLQQYLSKYDQNDNLWYPTGFTRDIVPKPLHSHNDYWRKVPLFDAIAVGAISVEADVWKFDGKQELYVGHDTSSLTKNRTFTRMYMDPILEMLTRQNPASEFASNMTMNGVFDSSRGQTLYLYVDLKTAPAATYNAVLDELRPLLYPKNYLTHYDPVTSTIRRGPVTVILTGNAPFDLIAQAPPSNSTYGRYAFYDCPLTYLSDPSNHFPGWEKYNSTNVVMGTAQFGKVVGKVKNIGGMDDRQLAVVRDILREAHVRGVGVRFWDTPNWSVKLKRKVWRQLVEEGVDLLNVDDLKDAAFGDW